MVVVDCDVDAGYARGHIPGAALVPDNFQKDPDNPVHLMNPDQFKAMCEGLGIGDNTLVVAYDNRQSAMSARLWWSLNTYGHSQVKVLDGGWRGWVLDGRGVSFAKPRVAAGATFTPKAGRVHAGEGGRSQGGVQSRGLGHLGRAQRRGVGQLGRPGATSEPATFPGRCTWNGSISWSGIRTGSRPLRKSGASWPMRGSLPDKKAYTY